MSDESTTKPAELGRPSSPPQHADAAEHRAAVQRFRAGVLVGAILWLGFGVVDYLASRSLGPGALSRLWGIRLGAAAVQLLAAWRTSREPLPSPRAFVLIDLAACGSASYGIALMAVLCPHVADHYPSGILLVVAARGAFRVQHWREGLLPNLVIAASYPLVTAFAALLGPSQLADRAVLVAAGYHLSYVVGMAGLTTAGSHAMWALRQELFEARRIGRYELRSRIGAGGMGEVWTAYHRGLKREVAMKILRAEITHDQASAARFEREVQATTELTHPNTVRVFDYGVTEEGLRYYAMELLRGETVAQLLRREGALPEARAVHLVSQAARSLAEAHALGIVHRDVKPANLFVSAAGGEIDFLKVLDFGIAKRVSDGPDLTRVGEVAGTPRYMAPEVVRGEPATPRSDVYALGAVLYELLAGRPPFEGDDAAAVCLARLTEAPISPSLKRGAPLDPDLEGIVLACLSREPAGRYATARELADALAALGMSWRSPAPAPRSTRPPADEVITVITPAA